MNRDGPAGRTAFRFRGDARIQAQQQPARLHGDAAHRPAVSDRRNLDARSVGPQFEGVAHRDPDFAAATRAARGSADAAGPRQREVVPAYEQVAAIAGRAVISVRSHRGKISERDLRRFDAHVAAARGAEDLRPQGGTVQLHPVRGVHVDGHVRVHTARLRLHACAVEQDVATAQGDAARALAIHVDRDAIAQGQRRVFGEVRGADGRVRIAEVQGRFPGGIECQQRHRAAGCREVAVVHAHLAAQQDEAALRRQQKIGRRRHPIERGIIHRHRCVPPARGKLRRQETDRHERLRAEHGSPARRSCRKGRAIAEPQVIRRRREERSVQRQARARRQGDSVRVHENQIRARDAGQQPAVDERGLRAGDAHENISNRRRAGEIRELARIELKVGEAVKEVRPRLPTQRGVDVVNRPRQRWRRPQRAVQHEAAGHDDRRWRDGSADQVEFPRRSTGSHIDPLDQAGRH